MNSAKRKGDRGEREVEQLIQDLLGFPARRKLGAGRKDDMGDVDGVPDTVIQVANWKNVTRAVREKPVEAAHQALVGKTTFAATFVRLPGGVWRVVLTPEQWATYVSEALDGVRDEIQG